MKFQNKELILKLQQLVSAVNSICGTSFTSFDVVGIHNALLTKTGLVRITTPQTFGQYMTGIAGCARYLAGRDDYQNPTNKSGLDSICEMILSYTEDIEKIYTIIDPGALTAGLLDGATDIAGQCTSCNTEFYWPAGNSVFSYSGLCPNCSSSIEFSRTAWYDKYYIIGHNVDGGTTVSSTDTAAGVHAGKCDKCNAVYYFDESFPLGEVAYVDCPNAGPDYMACGSSLTFTREESTTPSEEFTFNVSCPVCLNTENPGTVSWNSATENAYCNGCSAGFKVNDSGEIEYALAGTSPYEGNYYYHNGANEDYFTTEKTCPNCGAINRSKQSGTIVCGGCKNYTWTE